jgi:hypothetical protein
MGFSFRPALQVLRAIQAQLPRVDAGQVGLDVALKVAKAHAERFGGLPAGEQESLRHHAAPEGASSPQNRFSVVVSVVAASGIPKRFRRARRRPGSAPGDEVNEAIGRATAARGARKMSGGIPDAATI